MIVSMGSILASDSTTGQREASALSGGANKTGNASVTARILKPGSQEERDLSGYVKQDAPDRVPYPHANETAVGLLIVFLALMWIASMTMADLPATNETEHKNEK